jgi:hypothetical protein
MYLILLLYFAVPYGGLLDVVLGTLSVQCSHLTVNIDCSGVFRDTGNIFPTYLFACFFFVHFHATVPISATSGTMIEDSFGVMLDI